MKEGLTSSLSIIITLMCSSSQCEVTDQGVAEGEQYDPVAGRLYKDEVEECTVILAVTEALA